MGKIVLMYEDVTVAEVVTNHSVSVDWVLDFVDFDENKFLEEQGWDAIDYNDFYFADEA